MARKLMMIAALAASVAGTLVPASAMAQDRGWQQDRGYGHDQRGYGDNGYGRQAYDRAAYDRPAYDRQAYDRQVYGGGNWDRYYARNDRGYDHRQDDGGRGFGRWGFHQAHYDH